MRAKTNKKVVVAMSGGVDSSVAAALLKRAGFDVVGVFMRFWKAPADKTGHKWNRCCSQEAAQRARQVARVLGIPFYVFNFEKEFKKKIVDYFLAEYKAGRTPNPCVVCNKEIKFGLLLKKSLDLKADFIATGHYAKIATQKNYKLQTTNYKLLRAKDRNKDQSYFLWQLGQKELSRVLFPIGDYTKKEVRALAREFGLPTAKTKDSQEVCFIKNTTEEFLRKYLKEKPGSIKTPFCNFLATARKLQKELDKNCGRKICKVVGKHKGLWFYTIGQRKGIGLGGGPYYVVGKNTKKNTLIVSKNKNDLGKKELTAKNVNWVSGKPPKLPLKVMAKIRYKHTSSLAEIHKLKTKNYKLIFAKPQRAITPGQSIVFYKSKELLGGGIIC